MRMVLAHDMKGKSKMLIRIVKCSSFVQYYMRPYPLSCMMYVL